MIIDRAFLEKELLNSYNHPQRRGFSEVNYEFFASIPSERVNV